MKAPCRVPLRLRHPHAGTTPTCASSQWSSSTFESTSACAVDNMKRLLNRIKLLRKQHFTICKKAKLFSWTARPTRRTSYCIIFTITKLCSYPGYRHRDIPPSSQFSWSSLAAMQSDKMTWPVRRNPLVIKPRFLSRTNYVWKAAYLHVSQAKPLLAEIDPRDTQKDHLTHT